MNDNPINNQKQPADVPSDTPQDQPQDQPQQDFSKIEVQHYDAPIKQPLASLEETLGEKPTDDFSKEPVRPQEKEVINFKPIVSPPIKALHENNGVVVATTIAIIVLIAGLAGGFGGYQFFQGQVTTADTDTSKTTEPPKTIETDTTAIAPSETTNSTTAKWTNYANTLNKYTLKYPDTWYSLGADKPTSTSIQLTSFKPDANATGITSGQKIEIVFQDTNGKTLNDWIAANNAAMNAKVTSTKKTVVDTKEASEQTFSEPFKSIGTYLIHNDKVMLISYYAAETDFDQGITIYEDIINSIKLN